MGLQSGSVCQARLQRCEGVARDPRSRQLVQRMQLPSVLLRISHQYLLLCRQIHLSGIWLWKFDPLRLSIMVGFRVKIGIRVEIMVGFVFE